jgi:hypothetical protein
MTRRVHPGRGAELALLAACAVAACESDRTTTFDPVGPPSIDFAVGTGPVKLPAGRSDRQVVRTLVQTLQVNTSGTGTALTRPSGNTQDTLALDSSVTVVARALRALAGGRVYQVWSMAPDGSVSPAMGRVVEYFSVDTGELDPITGDPVFRPDSAAAVAGGTYAGSDDPLVDSVAFHIIPSDPQNVGDPFDNAAVHAVFVSIEAGPATTPGPVRFLWRRIALSTGGTVSNQTVTADTVVLAVHIDPMNPDTALRDTIEVTRRARSTLVGTGPLSFGNFGGLDPINLNSPSDFVFAPRGAGQGGARGPEISVDFQEIARPPVGFFYRGYIVNTTGEGVLVDTLRSAWDPDSTISRVNLLHADVNDLLPNVVGSGIRASQVRNCASGSGVTKCANTMALPQTDTFAGYAAFVLKLELKDGVSAAPTKSVSHRGDLPDEVK